MSLADSLSPKTELQIQVGFQKIHHLANWEIELSRQILEIQEKLWRWSKYENKPKGLGKDW